jgi:hypothetical protein
MADTCKEARRNYRGGRRGVVMFDIDWSTGSAQVCAPLAVPLAEVLAELPKPGPYAREEMGRRPWMVSPFDPRERPCPHKASRRHWSIES